MSTITTASGGLAISGDGPIPHSTDVVIRATLRIEELLKPETIEEMTARLKREGYTRATRVNSDRFQQLSDFRKGTGIPFRYFLTKEHGKHVVYFFDKEVAATNK